MTISEIFGKERLFRMLEEEKNDYFESWKKKNDYYFYE